MGEALQGCLQRLVALEWDDLPPNARQRAVQVLADDLVAALSALDEPQVRLARERQLASAAGTGQASVLAAGLPRLGLAQAATLNALAMGWNELDEGYRKAVCHGGLYVLPALLASAELRGSSMREVLRALVLGYETVARVAEAWRPPALAIHPHALLAPLGAAAGLAFVHRLPAQDTLAAVAGAATMGMVGPFNHALKGVLARNLWAAQGAAAGLNAVEWAQCGIGGNATSAHHAFGTVLGFQADPSPLELSGRGDWAIESGYQKVNACCQYAHSTIEAVQLLLARNPGLTGGEQVAAIEVEVHPLGYGLADQRPATTLGAKFSVPHAVAATVVHGHGGVDAFDARSLQDPRIARLREQTRLLPFADVRPWPHDRPARVTLILQGGDSVTAECLSARGGPDRPFGEAELWAKVQRLAEPVAPALPAVMRRLVLAATQDSEASALDRPWSDWLADAFQPHPA
jgi:2-methylcitrate dehydratase PrpD